MLFLPDPLLFISFILVSFGLIVVPGPNVMLIVSTALEENTKRALQTVAGTSSAMLIQLGIVVSGTGALLSIAAEAFTWLRLVGVAYLCYLGIRCWLRSGSQSKKSIRYLSAKHMYWRGFAISLTNPKTLLFFAALLPQFVSESGAILPQLLLLSVTFVTLASLLDSCYAVGAGYFSDWLNHTDRSYWGERVKGTLYIAAGLGLACAKGR